MSQEDCQACRFYFPAKFSMALGRISINYQDTSALTGECRRYPPIVIKANLDEDEFVESFGFPWIMNHSQLKSWCGEFKLKDGYPFITKNENP